MTTMYHVWVISEASRKWERYTAVPFFSAAKAQAWMREYIPHATAEIRKAS